MNQFIDALKAALPDRCSFASLEQYESPEEWARDPELTAIRALAQGGMFDADDYLTRYPDVAQSGLDPVVHFVRYGIYEYRTFNLPQASAPVQMHAGNQALQPPAQQRKPTISVIVTLWKRKAYIWEQYKSFLKQSIRPSEIIYIINEDHISPDFVRDATGENVKIITSPINSLYTRFSLAYIAAGDYVAIMDDDTMPGELWFENAVRACNTYSAYIVGNGRLINRKGKQGFFTLITPRPGGDGVSELSCAHSDIFCDWGCNSYFLKREWAGHLAARLRHQDSLKTFDDIQTAASLFMAAGIRCVCPIQPQWDKRLHASLNTDWGNDDYAVWRTSNSHFPARQAYLEKLVNEGYVPVHNRLGLYRFILIIPFADMRMLERCLLTVKGQVYSNYFCVLMDDSPGGLEREKIFRELKLDEKKFVYTRAKKRLYPLRSREIATDFARARLADIIIHLDGDDWLAHPHVLWQLNRIYRTGRVLATYGNLVSFGSHETRNFNEFGVYPMSKSYNMGQKERNAPIEPLRRIRSDELSSGWGDAPWSNMHLRTFQGSRWQIIDRSHFTNGNGEYLRVATDAAIFVPVLDSAPPTAVEFVPDISYVYQNCGNTIHAGGEVSEQETTEARASIADHERQGDFERINREILARMPAKSDASDWAELAVLPEPAPAPGESSLAKNGKAILQCKNAITSVISIDYLIEGLISISAYKRNTELPCDQYLFIGTRNPLGVIAINRVLEGTGIIPVFPESVKYNASLSNELEDKYRTHSDAYRWSMKGVMLHDLLNDGYDSALFLDSDIYTVSDITDVQERILQHDVSVFPHFRNADVDKTRKWLYMDGFFNGGMLGATKFGMPVLQKLNSLCLSDMVKDEKRQLYDDQKYYDRFIFDVEDLFINRDHGIDYNIWNTDPVEGLVAPTQRGYLLRSGCFARMWHLAHHYVKNAVGRKDRMHIGMRLVVAIYLQTKTLVACLLAIRLRARGELANMQVLQLGRRYDDIESWLNGLSRHIRFQTMSDLWTRVQWGGAPDTDRFLQDWAGICVNSICFDNLELFAQLLERFFPENQRAKELAWWMRRHDLRYITEDVLANAEFTREEIEARLEYASAGEIIKRRIELLRASKIDY